MGIRYTVLLALAVSSAACAQTIRVWQPPLPDSAVAADATDLVTLLNDAGYDAATVSTDALVDPSKMTPDAMDLLVVPARGSYPADGLDPLAEYLRAGGRVMTLGGVPFSNPLVRGPDGWEQVAVPSEPPGEVHAIADFDETTPHVAIRGGEDGPIAWETVEEDGHRALRASVADLQQWQYVEFPVADTGDTSFSVLHFRARGDANTPILGLELTETDQSRWKYVIPLGEDWREYTIFIPHFLSYATEGRGGEGDYLHPERLQTLSFGITKGMVGEGPHTFWLDDIERWQFEPPSRQVVPRDRSAVLATAKAYGGPVKVPPGQQHPLVRLFEDAEPCAGGWTIDVPTGSGPAYKNVVMSPKRTARVRPPVDGASGEQWGIVQIYDGALAGATIGFSPFDFAEVSSHDAIRGMGDLWLSTAEYMTRVPRVLDAHPDFMVAEGAAVLTLDAIVAPPVGGGAVTARAAAGRGGPKAPTWREERSLELEPGAAETLEFSAPAGQLDPKLFEVSLSTRTDGEVVDVLDINANVRRTLIDLCDFFVEQQNEDGVIAGAGFVDQRAVRALLVMYDQTGNRRYLDAAIRWGDNEIAMQREDGGYRMGYGITDESEVCYVADGGEIAIGMARLVSYVPEDRREAYIQSLRNYFRYRESFRLENGKIGVGWVFHDRYTQKGGDGVHEVAIRSDRSFGFVTACTLAAASAWQHITGEPEDRAMAIHDARWFLDDVAKATSVSAEAAQWAHFFIDDPDLRADLEQRMKETLVPFALNTSGWWYGSGGRSAVTLGALAYYHSQIEPSPEALAGILRGVYRMASPHSPASVHKVMADDDLDSNEWRYLAYGAVSLAEVLEPLSTMEGIKP